MISAYPKDPLRLKILVTVLVLSDAVHLSLVAQLGATSRSRQIYKQLMQVIVYYDSISTYLLVRIDPCHTL